MNHDTIDEQRDESAIIESLQAGDDELAARALAEDEERKRQEKIQARIERIRASERAKTREQAKAKAERDAAAKKLRVVKKLRKDLATTDAAIDKHLHHVGREVIKRSGLLVRLSQVSDYEHNGGLDSMRFAKAIAFSVPSLLKTLHRAAGMPGIYSKRIPLAESKYRVPELDE